MAKPLIGIAGYRLEVDKTCWNAIPQDYVTAVQNAGGIPVLLPFVSSHAEAAEVLDRIDGILFAGGDDVDPVHFGEEPHPGLGSITPERDASELALARLALERDMPLLGICRGHQLLAVAAGGTLWQDIRSQVPGAIKHSQSAPRWYPTHSVRVRESTLLARLLGTEFRVNSWHHQAVRQVPPGWVAAAAAPDGVNEAMEKPGARFALSVQWHPENFTGRPYNFDRLFTAFVEACCSTAA